MNGAGRDRERAEEGRRGRDRLQRVIRLCKVINKRLKHGFIIFIVTGIHSHNRVA